MSLKKVINQVQGAYYADGSVPSTALTSPLLTNLKNQLASAIGDKTYNEGKAAEYQSNYDRRYDCGGFKSACNNWLDKRDQARATVASLDNQIASLNTQIKAEENRLAQAYLADLAAQKAAAENKAATDPTLLAINTQAQKDAAEAKRKNLIVIGIIIFSVIIAIGGAIYFFKYYKK